MCSVLFHLYWSKLSLLVEQGANIWGSHVNPNGIESFSPGLLYSATLGKRSGCGANLEEVAAFLDRLTTKPPEPFQGSAKR